MTKGTAAGTAQILTVVVEDYFQVGAFSDLIPRGYWERFETNLNRDVEATLDLLEATGSRATFFSCGWIADNHPAILRQIVERGHEVACQGYFHHAIGELSREDFAKDVRRGRQAVEDAIGLAVRGFRIGRGWIGPQDLWALDVLAEAGFAYDSSLRGAGPQGVAHLYEAPEGSLQEVPPSSLTLLGQPMLLSGGNYLRQLPDRLMRSAVDRWVTSHGAPLVMYFHTWELGAEQPRIAAASLLQRCRHYRNLEGMPAKLRGYLERYDFVSIADHLDLAPAPAMAPLSDTTPAEAPAWAAAVAPGTGKVPLTLVIPCYNEAETLQYLEKTLQRFATQADDFFDLSYVLVDDGSSDDTWPLLNRFFGGRDGFTLLRHESNRGIAAALVTGFQEARTDYVAALDADCTFAPEQLFEMMALMTPEVDVVVASPTHAQGSLQAVPAWRSLLSRGAAFVHRCVFRHKLTSYTSCFRLYRRRVLRDIAVGDPGFCGVTEILGRLDLAGCRIVEYPAVLEARLLGASKIRVLRTVFGHLKLAYRLAKLRWLGHPLPGPAGGEMRVSYVDNDRK
ncbi:MAG: hypothetical protein Tsb0032_06020 [Kiloniellaceae bacterium]